jgi:hypothetical protein
MQKLVGLDAPQLDGCIANKCFTRLQMYLLRDTAAY